MSVNYGRKSRMKKSFSLLFCLVLFAFVYLSDVFGQQPSGGGGGGGGNVPQPVTNVAVGGGGGTIPTPRVSVPTTVRIVPRSAPRRTVTSGTRALAGTFGLVSEEGFPSPEFIFPVSGAWGGVRAITLWSLGAKLAETPIVNGRGQIKLKTMLPPGATTFQYFVETYPGLASGDGEFRVGLELGFDERIRLEGALPDQALFSFNPNIRTGNAAVRNGTAPSRVIAGMQQTLTTFPIPEDITNTEGTERKLTFYADAAGFNWGNVENLQLVVREKGGGETTYAAGQTSNYTHPFRPDVTVTKFTFDGVLIPQSGGMGELLGRVWGQPLAGGRRTVSVWADIAEWEVLGDSTRLSLVSSVVGPGFTLGEQTATFGTAEVKVTEVQGEIKYLPVFTMSGSSGVAVANVALNARTSDFPALLSKLAFQWMGQGVTVSSVRLYKGETLVAVGREVTEDRGWWGALLSQKRFDFESTETIRFEAGKDTGPQLRLVCTFEGFGVGQWGLQEISCVSPEGADAILSFRTTDAQVIVLPPFLLGSPFFGGKG